MNASNIRDSEYYPSVGELWDCQGKIAVICGNSFDDNKRIWIMEWRSGLVGSAKSEMLFERSDRKTLNESDLVEQFSEWSRLGNSDAMWWLAWWFEGVNHQKSVWYYVAALRANPKEYGWAQSRIIGDSRTAFMREGAPRPDITFLSDIPEMQGRGIEIDWQFAVLEAEQAIHIPAKEQELNRNVFT